jgi:hypothetical protein
MYSYLCTELHAMKLYGGMRESPMRSWPSTFADISLYISVLCTVFSRIQLKNNESIRIYKASI